MSYVSHCGSFSSPKKQPMIGVTSWPEKQFTGRPVFRRLPKVVTPTIHLTGGAEGKNVTCSMTEF